jgi:thioredoxin-related protein
MKYIKFAIIIVLGFILLLLFEVKDNNKKTIKEELASPEIVPSVIDEVVIPEEKPVEELPPENLHAKTYSEALELAKKTDRNIFVYMGATWCSWCEKMSSTTLEDLQVKEALSKYIVLHIDVDKDLSIAKKFHVKGIPAYLVIDKNENIIKRNSGYKNQKQFIHWLN